MRKKMMELAGKIEEKGALYFTENPINFDDSHWGCRYFLCFHNTHKIYRAYKTQREAVQDMEDFLKDGATIEISLLF